MAREKTPEEARVDAEWSAHNWGGEDDGSAFRQLKRERESFGNPPPSADTAARIESQDERDGKLKRGARKKKAMFVDDDELAGAATFLEDGQ
jgi:hypothetical protein